MELQQGVQALILGCALQGCAQAYRNGWNHSAESLDQQHSHYLIRVLEDLQGAERGAFVRPFPALSQVLQDLEGRLGAMSECLTWLLHCSCECHEDSKVS